MLDLQSSLVRIHLFLSLFEKKMLPFSFLNSRNSNDNYIYFFHDQPSQIVSAYFCGVDPGPDPANIEYPFRIQAKSPDLTGPESKTLALTGIFYRTIINIFLIYVSIFHACFVNSIINIDYRYRFL